MNNSFGDLFNNNSVRIALVGALAILSLYLLAQTILVATGFGRSGVPATDTITVQADGRATLPPDVARVSFRVEHTAATVAEAQIETTKQTNTAIEYVKGQGVAEKDVRTLSYNISPQYSYPNPCAPGVACPEYMRAPKVTGYQVSQTIQVTIRDLDKVGTILGGLGQQGVQNLDGPNFALDDDTAGYSAARADAIAKAKVQAKTLSRQLGVRLGKIVNFSESSGGYGYPVYGAGMMDAKYETAPTPNVPTGENTYSASVSVTYEIR